ncbi:MAG: choice-of-anchor D domain-containing protein [Kiritimatiellia bacterium]
MANKIWAHIPGSSEHAELPEKLRHDVFSSAKIDFAVKMHSCEINGVPCWTIRLLVSAVFLLLALPVFGGIGISWYAQWGGYTHDAPNVTDYPSEYALLNNNGSTWQLVYAGTNGIIDPPSLGNSANWYVSGDDQVFAFRTFFQGGGTAPEDGTTCDEYLYILSGDPTYIDESWNAPGFVYQRIYEGPPTAGSYYYDSPLFALDVSWTTNMNTQVFFAETDPANGGFKPDKTISGGGAALGEALDAPDLSWTTKGYSDWAYSDWTPTTSTTYDGIDAAESYVYAYNDSWLETTVTGPVAVSFWWSMGSSTSGNFAFAVDGLEQGRLINYSDWQYAAYAVATGAHTLRWTLTGGWSDWMGGGDAYGWLDQVTLSPVAPEIEILGRNSIGITNGSLATSTNNGTDFGAVFLTGATGDQTFAVRNWGVTNLDISAVTVGGTHSGDFQVVAYPGTVAANSSSNLILRFDPTAVGGRTATVTVVNNDADEGSYSFAVSGTGLPDDPVIRIQGSSGAAITNGSAAVTNTLGTDFGWQYLTGASTPRTFYVTNAGNSALNISVVNLTGANPDDFAVLSYPATVAAGTRSNLVVQFDPAALGARAAVVEISSDALGTPTFSFNVGGLGVPDEPEILVLGTNGWAVFDGDMIPTLAYGSYFGGVPAFTGSADRTFRITNSGSADLDIGGVEFQGSGAAHFSAPSVPDRVLPGTVSNLVVRFSPAAAGVLTAVVAIANNDADENPYEFAVRGDGTASHYVWTNSPSPASPYLSWETAAHTIQEAVDISIIGDTVWVTNGVYDSGVRIFGGETNRVVIAAGVNVRSVNGPGLTRIVGDEAARCIVLESGASFSGFTITNGHAGYGGGAWCGFSTLISNCVLIGNTANMGGGGAYCADFNDSGVIVDSILQGNSANWGGGAHNGTLRNCIIINNSGIGGASCGWPGGDPFPSYATSGGGGASDCRLYSCLIAGNSAVVGGGAHSCTLYNCTIVSNTATGTNVVDCGGSEHFDGGGIYGGWVQNCIIQLNTAPEYTNAQAFFSLSYSCISPPRDYYGAGTISADPQFVNPGAGDYRLSSNSPCINAGTNQAWMVATVDLGGNPRIANGTVDMGAYEYVPQAILPDEDGDGIPDDWEIISGLNPAVSNSPAMDSDGDGRPDIEEYWADTHPTNGASFFPMVVVTNPPLGSMVLVVDPTSTARVYGVRWTTNLLSIPQIWTLVPPEKMGTGSAVSFTVTNDGPGRIYRTGVRLP